jgi:threonine/homoserine/homoserine lactone efflux protein
MRRYEFSGPYVAREWPASAIFGGTAQPSFAEENDVPAFPTLLAFGLVSLGMVLTPGPNMIYLISRSLCQGRRAGLVSLGGVALGYVFYMFCAAFGITALLLTVPYAYDALRFGGALYLLYLAWQAVKPGGRSPFQVRDLPHDSRRKLFTMGLVTNLANPKIAVMYLSLLPQFISPGHGSVLAQSIALGCVQIVISVTVNALIASMAGSIAVFLAGRPVWLLVQRWLMGTVLAGLAVRIAFDSRR